MKKSLLALLIAVLGAAAHADDGTLEAPVAEIAHRWARINYQTAPRDQEKAFKDLASDAGKLVAAEPGKPQPLVWRAITLAGYAKAVGGLDALGAAKEARDLLLAAEKIDPQTLHGSLYVTLGSLYAKVPGWPIGFGDKALAKKYLETALKINPGGIDANYFYAELLADKGDYAGAVDSLQRALAAAPRIGREDADAGRRKEVQTLLDALRSQHADKLSGR
jgi:tetratricopeptide (TPR) repeat protein